MRSVADPEVETPKASHSIRSHRMMHLAMLITVTCWAANMVAIKEALVGFSPLALALVRAIGAAIVFGVLFAFLGDWSQLRLSRA